MSIPGGGISVFGLPAETFFWFVPWPFIWIGLSIIMYFKLKKEDENEEAR